MSYTLKVIKSVRGSDVKFTPLNPVGEINEPINGPDSASITFSQEQVFNVKVSKEGYETYENDINVTKSVTITPQLNKYVTLTINTNPEDATVIIVYNNNKHYTHSYDKIASNTSVFYVVSEKGKQTVSDTVVMNKDLTLDINLIDKITTDAGIVEYEGATSDKVANIKMLTAEEFNKLSPEEKSRYVQYDPKLSNFTGVNYTAVMTDALTNLYFMSPLASKIAVFTNGTMDQANFYFMQIIKQMEPIVKSASQINKQIRRLRKALSKVGLEDLIGILLMILQLIGVVATMLTADTVNPQNLLDEYVQAFKDIDLEELLRRTIGQTIPELQYVIDAMEGKTMPTEDMKAVLMDRLNEIMEISGLAIEFIEFFLQIQDIINTLRDLYNQYQTVMFLLMIITSGGALMPTVEMLKLLKVNYDLIKENFTKNMFYKSIKKCKGCLDDTLTCEKSYIDKQDLDYLNEFNKNSDINELDYKEGYDSAVENASNGETREEMEARLRRYREELENLGKDYKSYINGYSRGWSIGELLFRNNFLGLETKDQQDSYNNGYFAGQEYGKNAKEMAELYNHLGKLSYILDIDYHIHDANYNPIGRIEMNEDSPNYNKILSFPNEEIIGYYLVKSNEIELNNKRYVIANGLIFDTDFANEEPTEEEIRQMMDEVYKYMLIMIERGNPPDNNLNPYYSRGWKAGYEDKIEELASVDEHIDKNSAGTSQGYEYARIDKTTDQLTDIIENSQEDIFYEQGLITGYNNYQAEYNSGYSQGWSNSLHDSENESEKTIDELKEEFLRSICETYNLNYNTEKNKSSQNQNSVFRGANKGWDDYYNNTSENPQPQYREIYIKK